MADPNVQRGASGWGDEEGYVDYGPARFREVEPLAQHDTEREVVKINTIVPEVIPFKRPADPIMQSDFDRPGMRGIIFTSYDISFARSPVFRGSHVAVSDPGKRGGVQVLTGQPGPELPRTNIRRPAVSSYGDLLGER